MLVELFEFNIQHKPKTAIKAQVLAAFLVEMVNDEEVLELSWTLYIDGASSAKGYGAGVILEKEGNIIVERYNTLPIIIVCLSHNIILGVVTIN